MTIEVNSSRDAAEGLKGVNFSGDIKLMRITFRGNEGPETGGSIIFGQDGQSNRVDIPFGVEVVVYDHYCKEHRVKGT